jgi:hypothetical protein
MSISDIQLYELLASKLGRSEAQGLVEFVEARVDKKLEEKTNILVTKEDLSNVKVELVKWMVATGIVQDKRQEVHESVRPRDHKIVSHRH